MSTAIVCTLSFLIGYYLLRDRERTYTPLADPRLLFYDEEHHRAMHALEYDRLNWAEERRHMGAMQKHREQVRAMQQMQYDHYEEMLDGLKPADLSAEQKLGYLSAYQEYLVERNLKNKALAPEDFFLHRREMSLEQFIAYEALGIKWSYDFDWSKGLMPPRIFRFKVV